METPTDRLPQPPAPATPNAAGHGVLAAVALVVLLIPLVTGWSLAGMVGRWADPQIESGPGALTVALRYAGALAAVVTDLIRQTLGHWLLPAMAFALALHKRMLDLSVWMAFALAAQVGARVAGAGLHPAAAMAAVAATGAAVGGINAALVCGLRVPSPIATALVALLCFGPGWLLTGGEEISVAQDSLAVWSMPQWPLRLAAGFYVAAMLAGVLLARRQRNSHPARPRADRAVVLVAAGVLSALGGLCWLAKSGQAPPTSWRLIDLRVPAAAVLAGAVVAGARGRGLLVWLLMPPALLAATIWRTLVWPAGSLPPGANLLVLIGMVLAVQWVHAHASPARPLGRLWLVPAIGGIALLAATCIPAAILTPPDPIRTALTAALAAVGLAAWLAGLAIAAAKLRASPPPALEAPADGV